MTSGALRWWVLGIFVLSSAINYLDRQSLATLAPPLRAEFHLSYEQYGLILTAFSITYAACAPFAGLLIDRIGLTAPSCWPSRSGRAPASPPASPRDWRA